MNLRAIEQKKQNKSVKSFKTYITFSTNSDITSKDIQKIKDTVPGIKNIYRIYDEETIVNKYILFYY